MDCHTSETRSRNMSLVHGSDTKPELLVRSLLHRMGYRFRLHAKNLSGKPDIVLPRYRIVVFVHGCFWHQHSGCRKANRPTTRTDFWNKKLDGNIAQDSQNYKLLIEQGWRVLVVWECETKNKEKLADKLKIAIATLTQHTISA